MPEKQSAFRIVLGGIVQGVGFRPFVFRLAQKFGVLGWVINDSDGLTIHAEGHPEALDHFIDRLRKDRPPAARIIRFEIQSVAVEGCEGFDIRVSHSDGLPSTLCSPDLNVCEECLSEMRDPASRRYRYPYINCTNCGPRYSIQLAIPYDRANTTMAEWSLCRECQSEYDDPRNRRHHAQPTACNVCGPNYRLVVKGLTESHGIDAISQAVRLLNEGKIVAIKGIGGYHLACSPFDELAVSRLRTRKYRKEKPFALMVRDIDSAQRLGKLDSSMLDLLTSPARSIVLVPARALLPGVSDDSDEIGLMLPYAPIHHLLFDLGAPEALVMTSANRSSEPIAFRDEDAFERLGGIADAFLLGQRPIARRLDDSVMALRGNSPTVIRLGRGLSPATFRFPQSNRPILALGADLKNAVTLVMRQGAIVSQYIGDLGDLETDQAFERTIDDLLSFYSIQRSELTVAHDLHPGFVSTAFAKRMECRFRIPVQHHHAHLASVMAEHGDPERKVVGIVLDGTGYGEDGGIWGFEVFEGSVFEGFRRIAHLRPALLPGGDAAARFPLQAAAGFLAGIDTPDFRKIPFAFPDRYFHARRLVDRSVRCFETTSAGRLFDTAAALCGFTREISYEGQAAMWLENLALSTAPCDPYPFPDFDYGPLLASMISDRIRGRPVSEIAFAFHAAIADRIDQCASHSAEQYSTRLVALSGGVFQNRLLRSLIEKHEIEKGFPKYLFNREITPNDGGISLGQAAIAAGIIRD